jgi:hypothetical protein
MRAARQCRFAGRRAVLFCRAAASPVKHTSSLARPPLAPWLRINRVLRVTLHTRWSAEAWAVVRVEFKKALAMRSEIRRAGWFN